MTAKFSLHNALLLGMTLWVFACGSVAAAPRGEGGNDPLRKAQQLLQKLASEKAALETENLRLAEELKQVQSELAAAQGQLDKTEQARAGYQQRSETLARRVADDGERIRSLQDTHGKQIGAARADIQLLHNAVQERDRWIADCQSRNEAMYQANTELLAAYRDKGTWDALKQREPLTGLGSIKVENAVQEFQFRLEDLRTVKFEPAAAVEPQTP